MFERLRRSLALRLAGLYALVFALAAGLLFTALYWVLANALEAREQAAVERLAGRLTGIYEEGGALALRAEINSNTSPEVRSFFVRVVSPGNETIFASVPPDWVQTQVLSIPIPGGLGLEARRQIRTVRVPQNALRDYAIASAELADGSVLQVGRSTDSRAVLLKPFRTAFAWVGAAALALSLLAVGMLLAWRATRPLRLVSDTARRILETGDLSARVEGPCGERRAGAPCQAVQHAPGAELGALQVLRDTLDSLAHDLRTPPDPPRGTAELALHDGRDPEGGQGRACRLHRRDRPPAPRDRLASGYLRGRGRRPAPQPHPSRSTVLAERAADLYREVAEEKASWFGWTCLARCLSRPTREARPGRQQPPGQRA